MNEKREVMRKIRDLLEGLRGLILHAEATQNLAKTAEMQTTIEELQNAINELNHENNSKINLCLTILDNVKRDGI